MLTKPEPAIIATTAGTLYDALKRVQHSISEEQTRFYLGGAYVHFLRANGIERHNGNPGTLNFVTTDGHRLTVVALPSSRDLSTMPGVIIPAAAIADMLRTDIKKARNAQHAISLSIEPNRVLLSARDGAALVDCVPIDGTFPDYQRVIPNGNETRVTFERKPLIRAIAGVTAFKKATEDRGRTIKLAFRPDALTLSADTLDVGSCTTAVKPTDTIGPKADTLDIGFNGSYLLETLNALHGKLATFQLADPGSPTIITGDDKGADAGALHVLMPMRL